MDFIVIITNFPDKTQAAALARKIVDNRLAACVNILEPCTSVYRWEEKTESAQEIPLLIKTQKKHYPQIEQTITAMHPYELPEIITVPINGGLPAYLQWITDTTLPSKNDQ